MEKICGVDEAGRGPLAGPVVAAAVILPSHHNIDSIKDSKKLSGFLNRRPVKLEFCFLGTLKYIDIIISFLSFHNFRN